MLDLGRGLAMAQLAASGRTWRNLSLPSILDAKATAPLNAVQAAEEWKKTG
jgi:hypothetical protein